MQSDIRAHFRRGAPAQHRHDQVADAPDLAASAAELDKLLDDPAFECTERNKRFLRYVVEETLAGRADRLKGYTIAIAVFDRNETFDAQADPLVRIEAARLRRDLEHYYLTAGIDDPVKITIPKGGYVPVFRTAAPALRDLPPQAMPPRESGRRPLWQQTYLLLAAIFMISAAVLFAPWLHSNGHIESAPLEDDVTLGPTLLIKSFANISGDPVEDDFAAGLTEEVKTALLRFKAMRIYGASVQPNPEINYVLSGTIRREGQHYRVAVHIGDVKSGKQLWSELYERELTARNLFIAQGDIALRVAEAVGFPYNALFIEEARRVGSLKSKSYEAYDCLLRMNAYWVKPTPQLHSQIRACHEQIIAANPNHVGALVNLAWIYLNSYRFGFDGDSSMVDSIDPSFEFARRAISLDPAHARARYALAALHWFKHDLPSFHHEAAHARRLNPADTFIAGEYGLRLGMLRQWDRALPLLEQASRQNPSRPSFYRFALSLYALDQGDFAQALQEAKAIDAEIGVKFLVLAAIHGYLGQDASAELNYAQAKTLDLALVADVKTNLAMRGLDPVLIDKIVVGLACVGLPAAQ